MAASPQLIVSGKTSLQERGLEFNEKEAGLIFQSTRTFSFPFTPPNKDPETLKRTFNERLKDISAVYSKIESGDQPAAAYRVEIAGKLDEEKNQSFGFSLLAIGSRDKGSKMAKIEGKECVACQKNSADIPHRELRLKYLSDETHQSKVYFDKVHTYRMIPCTHKSNWFKFENHADFIESAVHLAVKGLGALATTFGISIPVGKEVGQEYPHAHIDIDITEIKNI